VLAKHGPRSADAQFLLAQAEMGNRNYQQAAPDFYDAYNRSRTGGRAPDALLGVANALIALGDRQSACDALVKLRTEFPQPRQDIRDGEAAARGRAACR
jgi:TolA-binding protein